MMRARAELNGSRQNLKRFWGFVCRCETKSTGLGKLIRVVPGCVAPGVSNATCNDDTRTRIIGLRCWLHRGMTHE